ncbi:hypothetical protein COT97_05675 [Candidatus Falkowbacteria bacterium CG10_big_fil_rev_8_21_14_0_10_39_11]|uniref:Uncharacterized protein n=1 Tax=Candidatus Falkowbacteria bacterium CG10_big_fil_rev_8_21_14_0_10_39_11 TaxID=1974565 RepID=A0A2H0V3F8_9BACT|nr:MAG: hypothetical protein COT97_05675 [Candidatus Falkowbacteria bacterium CG10_big_fil_rev_8_21_14_0_10_39_11]
MKLKFYWCLGLCAGLILVSGLIFHGCIFSYISDYWGHEAFGWEMNYTFDDSLAYILVFQYF